MTIAWAIIIVAVLFLLEKHRLLKKVVLAAAIIACVFGIGFAGILGYQWIRGRWEDHQFAKVHDCYNPSNGKVEPVNESGECAADEQIHQRGTPLPIPLADFVPNPDYHPQDSPNPYNNTPLPAGATVGLPEPDMWKWPIEGLPAYIAGALSTPDLAPSEPGIQTEVILSTSSQKQFISTGPSWGYCGSGGCSWELIDAATQRVLISGLGSLHKMRKLTNGYYDLLVEDKWGLYVYEYHGEKYENTICYRRSNGLGSSAILTSCTTSD